MAKYEIDVKLTGLNGNAYVILAITRKALRKHKVEDSVIEEYTTQAMSSDYDNLLRVTMAWVNVL